MEKEWIVEKTNFNKNKRLFPELEEATEKILIKRGIKNEQKLENFFVPDYEKSLHDPFLLNEMGIAVKRILKASKNFEKVCVFGDYDADGVTSSVVLTEFLKKNLELEVFCYIPDRENEGYGLNEKAIDFIKKKKITLIITVDCGITNVEEVKYAKKNKIDTIILDHHDTLQRIPAALAVIDPKNPKEKNYPFKELAGVGVVFKFIQAITQKNSKIDKEQVKWFLDLVAIGTVADCVPLLNENRTLVNFGLMVLSKTKRIGLRHLFQTGKIKINESELPTSQQIAFQIAPRINAAGRMNHANKAFELMTTKNQIKANLLARELEKQNQERQKITLDVLKSVKKRIASQKQKPLIIMESSPFWKLGIIGLSAGRLAEEYGRPVFLFQEKDGICKGSARSIPGFDLIKTLKRERSFLIRFGGHNQAAGLALKKENLEKFKTSLIKNSKKEFPKKLVGKIKIDTKLRTDEINQKFYNEISMLEPFGYNNEIPIFLIEKVKIINKKFLGNGEKHLKIWIGEGNRENKIFEAIGFGMGGEKNLPKIGSRIDLVFNLEENSWNGSKNLQLKIIDYKKS